jgi:hypothetical protein
LFETRAIAFIGASTSPAKGASIFSITCFGAATTVPSIP